MKQDTSTKEVMPCEELKMYQHNTGNTLEFPPHLW